MREWLQALIDIGIGGSGHQKIKPEFVLERAEVIEKILDNIEQALNLHRNPQFLLHLTKKCGSRRFAQFGAPTGEKQNFSLTAASQSTCPLWIRTPPTR